MNISIDLPTLSRLYGDTRIPDILFKAVKIPSGINQDDFVNEMYRYTNGIEVLYPDGQLMYRLLMSYSNSRLPAWERIYKAMVTDYEVTENYDRYEDTTNRGKNSSKANSSSNGGSTDTGNNLNIGKTTLDGEDKVVTKSMAYDSGSLVTNGETDNSIADRNSRNSTQYENNTRSNSTGETESAGNSENTVTSHVHGNIGVTTAQQMIREEIALRTMGVIDIICNEIVNNFCVKVW